MRVVVYHSSYGCDTGCCGHFVSVIDDDLEDFGPWDEHKQIGWVFSHPYGIAKMSEEEKRAWALETAQEAVIEHFGAEHVFDLDWENCLILED